jgi:hypothetical protein
MAEPSLLKYNSLAAALICKERVFRKAIFLLPVNELEEIEAKDDSLFAEVASLLSVTRPPEAAKDPTENMPAKVDAIYSLKVKT